MRDADVDKALQDLRINNPKSEGKGRFISSGLTWVWDNEGKEVQQFRALSMSVGPGPPNSHDVLSCNVMGSQVHKWLFSFSLERNFGNTVKPKVPCGM